jgi:hypothetical protein
MIDRSTHRVAFRNAKVIQEPLEGQPGTSFLFEVNGVRVFCGGSNWIPADSFLTEIEPGRYRKWVDLMVRCLHVHADLQIRGNQNMLRVWGGGVYEADELYEWVVSRPAPLTSASATKRVFSFGRTLCLAVGYTRRTITLTRASSSKPSRPSSAFATTPRW